MSKPALSEYQRFERKMKNLEANVPYVYFTGELSRARTFRDDVERMAKFVRAVHELDYGRAFQRRNREGVFEYLVVLHEKLGMRVDGNGRFQEAERIANDMQTIRITC